MTPWHSDESVADITFFFLHNSNFNLHEFTNFLLLFIGENDQLLHMCPESDQKPQISRITERETPKGQVMLRFARLPTSSFDIPCSVFDIPRNSDERESRISTLYNACGVSVWRLSLPRVRCATLGSAVQPLRGSYAVGVRQSISGGQVPRVLRLVLYKLSKCRPNQVCAVPESQQCVCRRAAETAQACSGLRAAGILEPRQS